MIVVDMRYDHRIQLTDATRFQVGNDDAAPCIRLGRIVRAGIVQQPMIGGLYQHGHALTDIQSSDPDFTVGGAAPAIK